MREDAVGMFWDDTPPPKVLKEKYKATPPERTWEEPGYLPGLAEALAFPYPYFTDAELLQAQQERHPMVFDVECYPNYFLVSFTSVINGKVVAFEIIDDDYDNFDVLKLRWVYTSFQIIGFNSIGYDTIVTELALSGATNHDLRRVTQAIIEFQEDGGDILKKWGVTRSRINHVDLMEVAPLQANLKIYGGRLHSPRMQDLPFKPDTELSRDQMAIVKMYNINADLVTTAILYLELLEQIKLRESLSAEYGTDLRSKSDAQIAESVIVAEVSRLNGRRVQRPQVQPGLVFYYEPPPFLRYSTPLLNHAFNTVQGTAFIVDENGRTGLPKALEELSLVIGHGTYNMGIGGLHSTEKRACHFSDAEYTLKDRDVTSYYPQLIINSGMFPPQLGLNFQRVYRRIVDRRVQAKAAKQKVIADSLKITANGTFGKLGSPWSAMYYPEMMIWVTLTGQLSLLMLIERMELAGIQVVSANTDGITMKVHHTQDDLYLEIIKQWEVDSGLMTEEVIYRALLSRDVNNYIAVKPDGKTKAKGAYSNPWADPDLAIFRFHKNPVNLICTEAVAAYVTYGTMPEETIYKCRDVTKFTTVRTVKGGGVKAGEFLGKSVRWYYAQGEEGVMVYAASGNKVPRSDGARPLLELPSEFPADMDFYWYVKEANGMIADLGLEAPGPTA